MRFLLMRFFKGYKLNDEEARQMLLDLPRLPLTYLCRRHGISPSSAHRIFHKIVDNEDAARAFLTSGAKNGFEADKIISLIKKRLASGKKRFQKQNNNILKRRFIQRSRPAPAIPDTSKEQSIPLKNRMKEWVETRSHRPPQFQSTSEELEWLKNNHPHLHKQRYEPLF